LKAEQTRSGLKPIELDPLAMQKALEEARQARALRDTKGRPGNPPPRPDQRD